MTLYSPSARRNPLIISLIGQSLIDAKTQAVGVE
jgi:hypothetical protein